MNLSDRTLAIGLSNFCKEQFPDTLGRVLPLHWGCAVVSAVCLSVGLLLSLRGIFSAETKRWHFILPMFCNLFFLAGLLSTYLWFYVVTTKLMNLTERPLIVLLPKLVTVVQNGNTEEKRQKAAMEAYELYGLKLSYQRDNGDFQSYAPTPHDEQVWMDQQRANREREQSMATLQGARDQWPYLFSFYLGALFITFVVGAFWYGFRNPNSGAST